MAVSALRTLTVPRQTASQDFADLAAMSPAPPLETTTISVHAQLTLNASPTSATVAFANPHASTKVRFRAHILTTASALLALNVQPAHVIKTPVSLIATPQLQLLPSTMDATAPTTVNATQASASRVNVSQTVTLLARLLHIKMAVHALTTLFVAQECAVELELREMVFASPLVATRDRIRVLIKLDATAHSMMNAARDSANLLELMQTLASHHALMTTKMVNSSMGATAKPT
jgi:hypothetical protein